MRAATARFRAEQVESKAAKKLQADLDALTNEIEQGFMQHDGWETCRYLLSKLIADKDIKIQKLQVEIATNKEEKK